MDFGVRILGRKYLNECIPSSIVSYWVIAFCVYSLLWYDKSISYDKRQNPIHVNDIYMHDKVVTELEYNPLAMIG